MASPAYVKVQPRFMQAALKANRWIVTGMVSTEEERDLIRVTSLRGSAIMDAINLRRAPRTAGLADISHILDCSRAFSPALGGAIGRALERVRSATK